MISRFQKIAPANKIINKTQTTKNQENSAQCFEENCFANHLAKILQVRIKLKRVGAVTVSTSYNLFFIKNV